MKRIIAAALVAVVVVLGLTGCMGADGVSPNGGAPSQRMVGDPTDGFVVLVAVYEAHNLPARRELLCTFAGFGPEKSPIYVTDAKTGRTVPYVIEVSAKSPARFPITSYANLYTIDVNCSAVPARPGDTIFCEFLDHTETRPAPLLMSIPEGRARDMSGIGHVATCIGIINALA